MHFRNTRIPRYIQNYLILPNEIFSHLLSIFIISYIYIVSKFYKISKEMYVFFFRDYSRYIGNRRFVRAPIADFPRSSSI